MEELKKVNSETRRKLAMAIVQGSLMCLQMLFVTFGVAYLYAVGGLLVKLFATVVGSIIVLGGSYEIVKNVKIAKMMSLLLKAGNLMEDILDKKSE